MTTEWEVPPPARRCATDGREFGVGELFRTILFQTDAGFERREYCLTCAPRGGEVVVGSWTARRAAPAERPRLDLPGLVRLLRSLDGDAGADRARLRFVLALLLWRKKKLRLASSHETATGEVWLFEEPDSDQRFEIVRPDLDTDDLDRLSVQLEQLVSGADVLADAPQPGASPEVTNA